MHHANPAPKRHCRYISHCADCHGPGLWLVMSWSCAADHPAIQLPFGPLGYWRLPWLIPFLLSAPPPRFRHHLLHPALCLPPGVRELLQGPQLPGRPLGPDARPGRHPAPGCCPGACAAANRCPPPDTTLQSLDALASRGRASGSLPRLALPPRHALSACLLCLCQQLDGINSSVDASCLPSRPPPMLPTPAPCRRSSSCPSALSCTTSW